MMWGPGWGSWVLGFLMMALFWGGLVVLAVVVLRGWGGRSEHGASSTELRPDARAILEERFARGEISEEEFEQRRRVLNTPP
jgi:putative membrane protein